MSRPEAPFTVQNMSGLRGSHWLVKITEGPQSSQNGKQDETCGLQFLAQVHPNILKSALASHKDQQNFNEFTFNKISPEHRRVDLDIRAGNQEQTADQDSESWPDGQEIQVDVLNGARTGGETPLQASFIPLKEDMRPEICVSLGGLITERLLKGRLFTEN